MNLRATQQSLQQAAMSVFTSVVHQRLISIPTPAPTFHRWPVEGALDCPDPLQLFRPTPFQSRPQREGLGTRQRRYSMYRVRMSAYSLYHLLLGRKEHVSSLLMSPSRRLTRFYWL